MRPLFLAGAGLAIAATTALAILGGGAAIAQAGNPGAQFFTMWDEDQDGTVTPSEFALRRGDIFSMFDSDLDDRLSPAEWQGVADHMAAEEATRGQGGAQGQGRGHGHGQQGQGQQGQGQGPGQAMHAALTIAYNDADGDGTVTRDEFVAAAGRLLAEIDRNGDGVLDASDFGRR